MLAVAKMHGHVELNAASATAAPPALHLAFSAECNPVRLSWSLLTPPHAHAHARAPRARARTHTRTHKHKHMRVRRNTLR